MEEGDQGWRHTKMVRTRLAAMGGGHVGPSSGHIHGASCGSHQGPRATPAFCNYHAARVFPSRKAGPVLGDRLDPMLLEACAQPVMARHAPTVVTPPSFLDSQVAP
jgi:hypothetical protein